MLNLQSFSGSQNNVKVQSLIQPKFWRCLVVLIQSARRLLLLSLGSKRMSIDTFFTIIVEIESILNSRPLSNVAEQPDNEEPLTPSNVPIQRPFNSLPPGQFGDKQPASLKIWKKTQKQMNHIWRHLLKEFLPTLSRRSNG